MTYNNIYKRYLYKEIRHNSIVQVYSMPCKVKYSNKILEFRQKISYILQYKMVKSMQMESKRTNTQNTNSKVRLAKLNEINSLAQSRMRFGKLSNAR